MTIAEIVPVKVRHRAKRMVRQRIQRIKIISREQWLAARKEDVTASIIASLWGKHPYRSHLDTYLEKTSTVIPEQQDSIVLRRGRLFEGAVAEAYRENHPSYKITKSRFYYRMPQLRLGATPDYIGRDDQQRTFALQCKTVSPSEFRRSWTDVSAPDWIALQTLTEAMLLRADYGVIACLVVDGWRFDLHEYEVPRHEQAERKLQAGVAKFWEDVAAKRMPSFDLPMDRHLIQILYPVQTQGSVIDLRGNNALPYKLERREVLIDEMRERKDERETIDAEIEALMGLNETALVRGWRITFKHQHRKEHMVKASDFRMLRITRDVSNPGSAAP